MASSRRFRENPGIQRYPRDERAWRHWINEVARWIADQEDVDTLNTGITNAKNASFSFRGSPGSTSWTSDTSGVFAAGDPTADLVAELRDLDDAVLASRTVEAQLDSSAGTITVTNTSKATTGTLTISTTIVADGSTSPRVDVTFTLEDGSKVSGSLAWFAVDLTTAATTPSTGAGK